MTAPTTAPGSDALARTVAYLAGQLTWKQRLTLRGLAGPGTTPRHEWTTTYARLAAMGLIDRVGTYGGQVTELGHAVLRRFDT